MLDRFINELLRGTTFYKPKTAKNNLKPRLMTQSSTQLRKVGGLSGS